MVVTVGVLMKNVRIRKEGSKGIENKGKMMKAGRQEMILRERNEGKRGRKKERMEESKKEKRGDRCVEKYGKGKRRGRGRGRKGNMK